MQQKSQVTCNCFNSFAPPPQKFFLTRKRQIDQTEPIPSQRRTNKSSDIKNDLENKTQKKSLKKRHGSYVHSDQSHPSSQELPKLETDPKFNPLEQVHLKSLSTWGRGFQTPSYSHQTSIANFNPLRHSDTSKHPETTNAIRQISYLQPTREPQTQFPHNYEVEWPNQPHTSHPHYLDRTQNQMRPQLLQIQRQSIPQFHEPTPIPKIKHIEFAQHQPNLVDIPSQQSLSPHEISFQGYASHLTPFNGGPASAQKSQRWTPEDLMIEGFDKLFKNKQQNLSQSNLIRQNKNQARAREVQRSKRFQKQQLFGRLAESDDDNCSESPPSQVIGKGFDRTYQDMFEQNGGAVVEQTKASRSTNTKVSELQRSEPQGFIEHEKTKFGGLAHYTSYKLF